MMLIKHKTAVNADVHRIISTVCGQNEENISMYLKVLFLTCYIKYMLLHICRTQQVTSHSVIPVAQLFHDTSAIFSKPKY